MEKTRLNVRAKGFLFGGASNYGNLCGLGDLAVAEWLVFGGTYAVLSVKIVMVRPIAPPEYQTLGAAGCDIASAESFDLGPLERTLVPSGFALEIPVGYEAQIRPRSGLALRDGLTVLNSPGTIDSDFRGEIKVLLINLSPKPTRVNAGDRIAQLVFAPVVRAGFQESDALSCTHRNHGGFGHTGR